MLLKKTIKKAIAMVVSLKLSIILTVDQKISFILLLVKNDVG